MFRRAALSPLGPLAHTFHSACWVQRNADYLEPTDDPDENDRRRELLEEIAVVPERSQVKAFSHVGEHATHDVAVPRASNAGPAPGNTPRSCQTALICWFNHCSRFSQGPAAIPCARTFRTASRQRTREDSGSSTICRHCNRFSPCFATAPLRLPPKKFILPNRCP
jgi:hypothetical protein